VRRDQRERLLVLIRRRGNAIAPGRDGVPQAVRAQGRVGSKERKAVARADVAEHARVGEGPGRPVVTGSR
jgi:hypothetical protein